VDDERSPLLTFHRQLYMCDIAVETCSMVIPTLLRLWLKWLKKTCWQLRALLTSLFITPKVMSPNLATAA
jgi:hypothetical protein